MTKKANLIKIERKLCRALIRILQYKGANKTYRRIKRFIRSIENRTFFKRTPFANCLHLNGIDDLDMQCALKWCEVDNMSIYGYYVYDVTRESLPYTEWS